MRTEQEIRDAASRALELFLAKETTGRSKYSGMTYEDGLQDAFDWVAGEINEDPTKS